MINIIGLGPGDYESLTIATVEVLKNAQTILCRTEKHPLITYIKEHNKEIKTYDYLYEELDNFDDVYQTIAQDIISNYEKDNNLVYAVPGHPLICEKSVFNLIKLCKEHSIEYKVIPAISMIDKMVETLEIDPTDGLKIIDAFDINNEILDKRSNIIITQIYNELIASEVKLKLSEYYDDEMEIVYFRSVGSESRKELKRIPIYKLDMQEDIDYLSAIYIPKDKNGCKDIYDLINLVDILRGDEGCPWDKEQTHESIKNSMIEESYEVVDAIEKEDTLALEEELGDVLLQVVFHAAIEKEEGYFNFNDVVHGIYNKMVYRHPHVFGDNKIENTEEVLINWDELKKKEKNYINHTDELLGVANALPALIRAKKVQSKASKVGFDFDNVYLACEKVKEELNEVLEVYKTNNQGRITEEMGDLIFSCVNVSRFLKVECEDALQKTTDKFIKRFQYIEEKIGAQGKKLEEIKLEEMDYFWEMSKRNEK